MQKYYTTLDLVDNNFIGTVYESSSNVAVFKSQSHTSQIKAMEEINSFLDGSKPANNDTPRPQTIVNTVHRQIPAQGGRACCGRR